MLKIDFIADAQFNWENSYFARKRYRFESCRVHHPITFIEKKMYNIFFIFLINLNLLFFTVFFSNLTIFLPILLLILLILSTLFLEQHQYSFLKNISFLVFFLIFVFYSLIFIFYSKNLSFDFFLFFETSLEIFLLNLNIIFAIDTISLLFLILTSLVCFLSVFIN